MADDGKGEALLQNDEATNGSGATWDPESFEQCHEFTGSRLGWVFKKGDCGLGYYKDCPPKRSHPLFGHLKLNNMIDALRYTDGWHDRDKDGSSTLHWAALLGNVDVMRKALAEGVQVDCLAGNNQTPLFWAVTKGQINAVKVLLEHGADPLLKDSLGASPPIIAVQFKQATVLLFLLARAKSRPEMLAVSDKKGCSLVHWASYVGDMAGLKILEYFKADFVGIRDNDGKTALHRSVSSTFNRDIIEYLLDHKVSPYVKDDNGKTFVDLAGDMHGRSAVDRSLKQIFKDRGINPDCEEQRGDDNEAKDVGDIEKGTTINKASASSKNDFEKMMKFGPAIFWLACVSMTVFEYLIDIRSISWTQRPFCSLFFEIGVPLSLFLFVFVSTRDPGIIQPRQQERAIEDVMKGFELGSFENAPKLCSETWVIKPPRSKYCRETGRCIEEFDHFCGWLNCAIGRNNHRPFVVLALVEVTTQLLYVYLGACAALELVPVGPSYTEWFLGVGAGYPLLLLVIFLQTCTAFLILNLVKFQANLIVWNYTTNECINAERYGYSQGGSLKTSPFHKGSWGANCMDFWYVRTRAIGVDVD
mmetsp:Transcript_150828/g.484726  ORF Transcript_150828/g.484726 Transcript_150828/m.484726 type:complete len:588 (-) Transcript_150828:88-1851(-)